MSGSWGRRSWGPLSAPQFRGLLAALPPSAGSVVPSLSPPSGGGGRRGCFPSSLPHLPAPPRQKSAPPLLADGLSSCDSVLAWGGRVAEVKAAGGRPSSPPGHADPPGEASCLCVAGMPALVPSVTVPGSPGWFPALSVPTASRLLVLQPPRLTQSPLPSAIFRFSPRVGGPSPVIWSLAV